MFRELISIEKARQLILENCPSRPIGIEEVSINEAFNRILAENITALFDVPQRLLLARPFQKEQTQ